MKTSSRSELKHETRPDVRREFAAVYHFYRPHLPQLSRWEDERDRWHELAFAAIAETSGLSIAHSRRVADGLMSLSVISMTDCINAAKHENSSGRLPAVAEALRAAGVSESGVEKTVNILVDLALGVESSFGKIQKLLRKNAEDVLATLNTSIPTPTIDDVSKGRIFTMWLQSVIEAPISMTHADPALVDFCERHGASVHTLVEIADEADLNVSVLDCIIRLDSELFAESRKNIHGRSSK
jgi:hypothetical protein